MSVLTPEETQATETGPRGPGGASPRIGTSLRMAIGSSFILRLAGASTGFLLQLYLKRVVHADANLIGVLSGVYYVTELLLAPVFGAFSDLRGRKPFLVLGPLAGAVAVQIHPLTTIAAIIAIGRLLEGVTTAANAPGTLGYLADATSGTGPKRASFRGRVMGMYEISFLVGLAAGQFLGGYLWDWLGSNGVAVAFLVGIYIWSHLYGRMRRTGMMLASIAGVFIVCFTLLGINNNILPGPWGQWPLLPLLAAGVLLESGFTPVALAYLADISET